MNAPVFRPDSNFDTKIRKRSVMISGHATSVSLEQAFWQRLKAIAKIQGVSVNALIAEIDGERPSPTRASAPGISPAPSGCSCSGIRAPAANAA